MAHILLYLALSFAAGVAATVLGFFGLTMVAGGASTPDIARGMLLSRRTVQTHISHILTKLGARGRVDIVREALRQGISA